jgi:hypothetical protein
MLYAAPVCQWCLIVPKFRVGRVQFGIQAKGLKAAPDAGSPASVHCFAMLSPKDIARIKADLAMLEKARDNCADTGLRKVIDAWIEDAKETLVGEANKDA